MKRTHKAIEFDQKQSEKQSELFVEPEPKNQKEKDIWNLKYLRYSIKYGSFDYQNGMIKTLDRAIKKLEAEKDES